MTNYLLQRIEPIKEHIIATNPFEVLTATKDNIRGLKACIEHLEKDSVLQFSLPVKYRPTNKVIMLLLIVSGRKIQLNLLQLQRFR